MWKAFLKIFLLGAGLGFVQLSHGQGITWDWGKSAGGNLNDHGNEIAVRSDGTSCVVGSFMNTMTIGSASLVSSGNLDVFYAKYDALGNVLWAKRAGGTGEDIGWSIWTDPSGFWLITGSFTNTITFDNGGGGISLVSAGGRDIFLAKVNPANGLVLWAVRAGGGGDDKANSVASVDTLIYIGGSHTATATFGAFSTGAVGGFSDAFVAAYSETSASFRWLKPISGPMMDDVTAVTCDSSGVYVTGSYAQGPVPLGFANLPAGLQDEGLVVKWSPSGTGIWAKNITSPVSAPQIGKAISVGPSGLYVLGDVRGGNQIQFAGPPTLSVPVAGGNFDIFLARLNPTTGVGIWGRSFGSPGTDLAWGVDNAPTGVVFSCQGQLNFVVGTDTFPNAVANAGFLGYYDSNGNFLDAEVADGPSNDALLDVEVVNACRLVTTGFFANLIELGGTLSLSATGAGDDVLVADLDFFQGPHYSLSSTKNSICIGDTVVLTASPNGLGVLQWQSSPTGTMTWTNIPGATTQTVSVAPGVSTDYRIVLGGLICPFDTLITVEVNPLPIAQIQQLDSFYCANAPNDTVSGNFSPAGAFVGLPPGITTLPNGRAVIRPTLIPVGTGYPVVYIYTDSLGCQDRDTGYFSIKPLPILSIAGLNPNYCETWPLLDTLIGSQTGGVFTGPGLTILGPDSVEFAPGTLPAVNTYPITYSFSDPFGCSDTLVTSFNVLAAPVASITGLDPQYCEGVSQSDTVLGLPAGGAFTPGAGITFVSPDEIVLDPSGFAPGTGYSVVYSVTDSLECSDTDSGFFDVTPTPIVSFTGLNNSYCSTGALDTLTGSPLGGTFSGIPGISVISPGVAEISTAGLPLGTTPIYYSYTDGFGCEAADTQLIVVTAPPTIVLGGLLPGYCVGSIITDTVTASPAGGIFSGVPGIAQINPFSAEISMGGLAVQTYWVQYDFVDTSGCVVVDSLSFEIHPLPTIGIVGLDSNYCEGSAADTVAVSPSGGVFSSNYTGGTAISSSSVEIDPRVGPVGSYSFHYSFTDLNGCTNADSADFSISALPVVSFTGLNNSYCSTGTLDTLTGNPLGGTFTGIPGIAALSPGVAEISSAGIPVGNTPIYYTYTDGLGCEAVDTQLIVVTAPPAIVLGGLQPGYCVGSIITDTVTASPSGGIFSGVPGMTQLSPSSAEISMGGLGVQTYWVQYDLVDTSGCVVVDSLSFEIYPLPTISLLGLDSNYCEGSVADTVAVSPSGGVFTSNYAGAAAISGSSVEIDPSVGPVGSYSFHYSFTDLNGCTNADSADFSISALPVVSFSGLNNSYCSTGTLDTLTGNPLGGTFSGIPGIAALSPGVAEISSAGLPVGNTPIYYTYTDGLGCEAVDTQLIVVTAPPTVVLGGLQPGYCVGSIVTDTVTASPSGGIFSGVLGMTQLSPSSAEISMGGFAVQTYWVQYDLVDTSGCVVVDSLSFEIYPLPTISFSGLDTHYCIGGTPDTLTPTPIGGTIFSTYTGFSTLPSGQIVINPAVGPVGNYSFEYTATDSLGCSNTDSILFQVGPLPLPVFSGLDSAYCFQPGIVDTLIGNYPGGLYGGPAGLTNLSGGIAALDLDSLSPGIYSITYSVQDSFGCQGSVEGYFEIVPPPSLALSGLEPGYCAGTQVLDTLDATPVGGAFSFLPGFTQIGPGQGELNLAGFTPGTYWITYSFADTLGCVAKDSVSFSVSAGPAVSTSGLGGVYCPFDHLPYPLIGSPSGGTFASSFSGLVDFGNGIAEIHPLGAAPGGYMVSYSVTDSFGCQGAFQDSFWVTVPQQAVITHQGPDTLCNYQSPVRLMGAPANGTFSAVGGITQFGNGSASFDPQGIGFSGPVNIYYAPDSGCWVPDTLTLQIWQPIPTQIIGMLPEYCEGDGMVGVVGSPQSSQGIFTLTGGSSFTDNGDGTGTFNFVAGQFGPGNLAYTAVDSNGCYSTVEMDFNVRPLPIANAGPDQQVTSGVPAQMAANSPSTGQWGNWTLASGNGSTNSTTNPSALILPSSPINSWVWTVSDSVCGSAEDTVVLMLLQFVIPTGFSPNGDGVNDFWEIRGIENYPPAKVLVFNRWGNLVYENERYDNSWRGVNASGQDLVDDTYYAILQVTGMEEFKTYVVIKR